MTRSPEAPTTSILDDVEAGLPADRQARLAARRAFVEMKQVYMRAVEPLRGHKAQWLRDQVRLAHDPMDLWLLRGPVMAAVQVLPERFARGMRAELYRGIDSLLPEAMSAPAEPHSVPSSPDRWAQGPGLQGQAIRMHW